MGEPAGKRRCVVGVGLNGSPLFEQFVRLDYHNEVVWKLNRKAEGLLRDIAANHRHSLDGSIVLSRDLVRRIDAFLAERVSNEP